MQPRSQGLSSYRPGGGKMRNTGNEVAQYAPLIKVVKVG